MRVLCSHLKQILDDRVSAKFTPATRTRFMISSFRGTGVGQGEFQVSGPLGLTLSNVCMRFFTPCFGGPEIVGLQVEVVKKLTRQIPHW